MKQSLKMAMKTHLLAHPDIADGLISHSKNLFKLNNSIIHECDIQKSRLFKVACGVGVVSALALITYFTKY